MRLKIAQTDREAAFQTLRKASLLSDSAAERVNL